MGYLTIWLLTLLQLATLTSAGAANWTKPNGQAPSFTDTYILNERIYLSWFSLNDSINDLWLTRYDTRVDNFSSRLAVALNISSGGTYEWTISVNTNEVEKDTRFILQWLPTGAAYDPKQTPYLPSPGFNLIELNQASPPNGTMGAPSITPSATKATVSETSTSSSSLQPSPSGPPPGGNGTFLSRSAIIGIAVGAAILVTGSIVAAYFVVRAYRPSKPDENVDQEFKSNGPYEVMGNKKHPTELSSKETMISELSSKDTTIYEMNGSKETIVKEMMVSECESPTSVYELSTTIKKPGLHELPG